MLPSLPKVLKITMQNIRVSKLSISVISNNQHTYSILTKEQEKKLGTEEIQIFLKEKMVIGFYIFTYKRGSSSEFNKPHGAKYVSVMKNKTKQKVMTIVKKYETDRLA